MILSDILKQINNKEDFIKFMEVLKDDKINNLNEWENTEISSYLESISTWVEDMDGYYANMGIDIPTNINWEFVATLFYVGKIYE